MLLDGRMGLNEVEDAISTAIAEFDDSEHTEVMGQSLIQHIYSVLKDKGYLKDQY